MVSLAVRSVLETAAHLGITPGEVKYIELTAIRKLRRRIGVQSDHPVVQEFLQADACRRPAIASAWPTPDKCERHS